MRAARGERAALLRQARQRLILDGARAVFAEHGLDGATIRAIAAASGYTTGAVYPLFPSKEAIYAALLHESLARLDDAVAGAPRPRADAASALRAGALAFVDYYRDRPDEVALGLHLWNGLRPRGLGRALDVALNERLHRSLDRLRAHLAAHGRLPPPAANLEVAGLFAFLIGALVVHQTGRLRALDVALDAIVRRHVDALLARLAVRKPGGRGRPAR